MCIFPFSLFFLGEFNVTCLSMIGYLELMLDEERSVWEEFLLIQSLVVACLKA